MFATFAKTIICLSLSTTIPKSLLSIFGKYGELFWPFRPKETTIVSIGSVNMALYVEEEIFATSHCLEMVTPLGELEYVRLRN